MKTQELIEMLAEGCQPVIRIKKDNDSTDMGEGMIGRIIKEGKSDIYERGTESICLVIDMTEFEDYNKSVAKAVWADESGEYTKIWHDSKYYPKNHKTEVWEMRVENFEYSDLQNIELLEESKWFKIFKYQTKFTSYTRFLENELDKHEKNSI